MIAVDTNVLVRLLVGDDPEQLAQATALLHDAREKGVACFISDPVLCEIEWVLESCYGASRADVLAALRDLLASEGFVFEDRKGLMWAIEHYQTGKADFSDYLIGAKGRAKGATATYTFDKGLRGTSGFIFLRDSLARKRSPPVT
jgi:predicted nucleic-acid-binding protein